MNLKKLEGNHLFGRDSCPYSRRARNDLKRMGIEYIFHDVEANSSLYDEMATRVREIKGATTRITVPQIWLKSEYIGGSDDLRAKFNITDDEDPPYCPI